MIILNDTKLQELEKFGFVKNEDDEYEYKEYYPLEDDGTRYEDDNGFDYVFSIRVIFRKGYGYELYLEVINNDCSYHNEGSELEKIMEIIYELTVNGVIDKILIN